MTTIDHLRDTATTVLKETLGLPVYTTLPTRLHPPFCYLREADQFIRPEEDGPYGSWVIRFSGAIAIEPAANHQMVKAADMYATRLLAAADAIDIEIDGYNTETAPSGQPILIVPFTASYIFRRSTHA